MTIEVKAIEQYFHVVLFIVLYKVVLTFQSADETSVVIHMKLGVSTFMRSYSFLSSFQIRINFF